jgi:uncharacterized protein (TIGR03000 family)
MKRFAIWTFLAVTGILASTNAADASHGRRHGCHGCSGGYYSGCSGTVYSCSGSYGCSGASAAYFYYSGSRYSYYPPSQQVVPQGERAPAPTVSNSTEVRSSVGTINFRAPAEARIWVDGNVVNRTGETWRYTTPALRNGQRQSYEVKASWTVDGKVVNQNRTVTVEPGGRMTVDFNQPANKLQDQNRLEKNNSPPQPNIP